LHQGPPLVNQLPGFWIIVYFFSATDTFDATSPLGKHINIIPPDLTFTFTNVASIASIAFASFVFDRYYFNAVGFLVALYLIHYFLGGVVENSNEFDLCKAAQ
jgi:hypothetical protein